MCDLQCRRLDATLLLINPSIIVYIYQPE